MIAQSDIFSRKNVAQRKQKFALSFAKIAQKYCEWKPYHRAFHRQDASLNFIEEHFTFHIDRTFHSHDILQTCHFIDMKIHRLDIL